MSLSLSLSSILIQTNQATTCYNNTCVHLILCLLIKSFCIKVNYQSSVTTIIFKLGASRKTSISLCSCLLSPPAPFPPTHPSILPLPPSPPCQFLPLSPRGSIQRNTWCTSPGELLSGGRGNLVICQFGNGCSSPNTAIRPDNHPSSVLPQFWFWFPLIVFSNLPLCSTTAHISSATNADVFLEM